MLVKRICIVTQSHLCRNPRVLKEAIYLDRLGHEVSIVNSTHDRLLSDEDILLTKGTNIQIISVSRLDVENGYSLLDRFIRKIGVVMTKNFGIQTIFSVGYGSWRYWSNATKQNADLYIAHQELGLYCGIKLIKAGKKVAFDFEDWYSEDLSGASRKMRPIRLLKQMERFALKNAEFCLTTSSVMGKRMAETYSSPKPVTVYNTFNINERLLASPKNFTDPLKLIWFSQTIGPGRGLEQFFELIKSVKANLEIHLLGNINQVFKAHLVAFALGSHQVYFHPVVPSDQLTEKISEFDIGLALDLHSPLSRDLTITNKFFQYMISGLPVISTATSGQMEIFAESTPGFMLEDVVSRDMTARLEAWLCDKNELKKARANAIKLAQAYNWEKECLKLKNLINKIV